MKIKISVFFILAILMVLSACKQDATSGSGFDGTYTYCFWDAANQKQFLYSLVINGNAVSYLEGGDAANNNCATTSWAYEFSSTVIWGKEVSVASGMGKAMEADHTPGADVIITLKDAAMVTEYNAKGICSKTDWALNQAATVPAVVCGYSVAVEYTLLQSDGSTLHKGKQAGASDDGSTASRRHSDVDLSKPYKKKL